MTLRLDLKWKEIELVRENSNVEIEKKKIDLDKVFYMWRNVFIDAFQLYILITIFLGYHKKYDLHMNIFNINVVSSKLVL